MTRKVKRNKKMVKRNGYNDQLQETYINEVLDEDKFFDDEFKVDWGV